MSRFSNTGVQPDGDSVKLKADGQFFSTSTNLGASRLNGSITAAAVTITVDSTTSFPAAGTIGIGDEIITYTGKNATQFTGCTRGAEQTTASAHDDNAVVGGVYVSSWFDTDGWGTLELFFSADVPSKNKGIRIQYTDDTGQATPTVQSNEFYEFKEAAVRQGCLDVHVRPKLDGFRAIYINGSEAQSSLYISSTGRVYPETGLLNSGNAQITAEFAREVSLGNIANYSQNTKFGRNSEVDSGTPADLWDGGTNTLGTNDYTGQDCTAEENIAVVSSSAADAGTLVSSGAVTTTGSKTLIDSGATFVTDGVAVGDIVLNDSRGTYGYVTSVDSETQLTVFQMIDSEIGEYDNVVGNSYRVATAASTGAAVVSLRRILDSNFEKQKTEFVILNGVTTVTVTANAYRCSRGQVLLSGSGGANAGTITANQAVTTGNIFFVMRIGTNQTLVAADTVPAREIYLIEGVDVAMSVSGGVAASGVVSLRTRPFGGSFNTIRIYELSSGGGPFSDKEVGGVMLQAGTDFKLRVDSTSANNVRFSGKIEYLEIDEV